MPDQYAVIGNPVAHSKSPLIHAAFARQTGQDLAYERLLAPKDAFVETANVFRARGGRGLNVTLPFQGEAIFTMRSAARSRIWCPEERRTSTASRLPSDLIETMSTRLP